MIRATLPGGRTNRALVGALGGAVVSATFAAATLGSAAPANATCASFFGIGNSAQCTSSPTSIAIALGPGATAKATGLFTVAIANGLGNGAGQTTIATADGSVNLAYAGGSDSVTVTHSNFSVGIVQGKRVAAVVGSVTGKDFFNSALSLGSQGLVTPTQTATYTLLVAGNGNMAVDFGGGQGDTGGFMEAYGTLNSVFSFGSRGSFVGAGTFAIPLGPAKPAVFSTAFNLFGTGNIVTTIPGPLSIAGSIGQTGATIKQAGPGININNTVVLSAAATGASNRAASAAASNKRPSAADGSRHKASAAASTGGSKRGSLH
ncbi:hypothetical protein [Mycolicibacterium sphagni]|uniref:Uncharacterized protein n=1 Tax=Mycolicibacterium sphagni TaxID=1786 RepID=A0ABX2JYU8_9MYCO|nr:hypothetical protein [Mycolicibacterium sphagni]NTY61927.1 hypothetical protein [Mycolicibacterium sphagni]